MRNKKITIIEKYISFNQVVLFKMISLLIFNISSTQNKLSKYTLIYFLLTRKVFIWWKSFRQTIYEILDSTISLVIILVSMAEERSYSRKCYFRRHFVILAAQTWITQDRKLNMLIKTSNCTNLSYLTSSQPGPSYHSSRINKACKYCDSEWPIRGSGP